MKKVTLESVLDQRKLSTHVYFLLFSLLVVVITIVLKGDYDSWKVYITALILVFLQIEVFIFLGKRIFKNFKTASSPKDVTRIVILRFILFFLLCFIAAFILMITVLYIENWIRYNDTTKVIYNFFHYEFRGWFKSTFTGLSAGAILFVYFLWQDSLKREQKLREENLIFQNETLRNQVNPHFLFNSLNTLSSLISSQPEVADRFVSKLASIYRYILENSRKDNILLESELEFIRNYSDLHKVRDEEKIVLTINVPDPAEYEILPVSLQIIIENAIKHNKATRESPLHIDVFIEDRYVVVRNNLQKMALQMESTGTGLRNLAERVRLMTGKPLIVEETNDTFIVQVPLI
ncbi:MAG: histidine kinase [Bacteroidia bacterium]|nr:histidine kinase [Bacteroidia bacterium]